MKTILTVLILLLAAQTSFAADLANVFDSPNSYSNSQMIKSFKGASMIQIQAKSTQECWDNLLKVAKMLDNDNKVLVKVTNCDKSKNNTAKIFFF